MKTPGRFSVRPASLICAVAFLLAIGVAPSRVIAAAKAKSSASSQDVREIKEHLRTIEKKIEVTKQEISKVRDASFLPDLYFALADMQTQKARIMYLLKIAEHPGQSPDTLDFTAEKRPKLEAIEIYQKIYNFFPKEKRRDRALFLTGLEQREIGSLDAMVRTFTQLSKEFPESAHFAEANIILGDFLFEQKKDLDAAIEVFRRITTRPMSPFTPLAHYRIGWCYINQSKYEDAIKAYEDALSAQQQTNADELPEIYRKADIRREAVIALALPYVEVLNDPKNRKPNMLSAVDYFRQKSPDHFTYRRVLSRAGKRLTLKEQWADAANCYFHVLALSTEYEARFDALQRLNDAQKKKSFQIDLYAFVREIGVTIDLLQASMEQPIVFDAAALKDLDNANKNTGSKKDKTPQPAKMAGGAPANRVEAINQLQFLELLMRDFATRLHERAKSTGSPSDFEQTADAYQAYLNRFPVAPKALDIQYNLAETDFKANRLVRAGIQYERLSLDSRLAKKAVTFQESAIESYTKAAQDAERLSPLERIRARHGLRDVGTKWLKTNAQAQLAPSIAFNIANSWYEERALKKAIDAFQEFVRKYPKDERVRDAIFLTINSYSQMDDYKGLERTGSQLLKTAVLGEADRGSIEDAIRRARTKQLQSMGGAFGSKEYAENLLSVASKYKGSALGVQALYEAFNSLKSKRDPELFEVGEAFLDQHADSGNAKEVASSMAMLALSTASFDRAAKYLARFAEKYPKEKESLEFKKTAAMLFERQADFKKARQAYQNLGDREGVARMDLALNDWSALEASSVESGSPNANYWRALAIWRQRRQQDALPLLKSLAAQGTSRPDQSGHARFLLSQMALDRFRGIKMKSAEDQAALAEKVKAFQALSSELQELIKSGTGKWPIAALYLLGQTHYDLGRFIADSPLPPGLSEADKKAYMAELSNQAGSYLSEAEKVFSKCVDAAQGNDVFTRYVDGCRARGRKLIKEEDDVAHLKSKNAGVEPAKAKAIRAKLIENSKDVNLLLELGEIYMSGDQPQTAMGIFARVLEIEPENARAIASIGVASMSVDELDSAYGSFKQALKINPKEGTALWNLAGLYKQFGFTNKLAAMRGQMSGLQAPKLLHPWSRGL